MTVEPSGAAFAHLLQHERPHVFPEVEIITRRLRLRAYTELDVDEHAAIFDHQVARNWSIAPRPYDRRRAEEWCTHEAERIRRSGEGICWAGVDRETNHLVGMTGFHRTDWGRRVADVSATAAAPVIGRGYASEALRAISHWLLIEQQFNRIQATIQLRNRAARYVAEGCGFVREGVLRSAGKFRGRMVDEVLYSLIPNDLDNVPRPDYQVRHASPSTTLKREMEAK